MIGSCCTFRSSSYLLSSSQFKLLPTTTTKTTSIGWSCWTFNRRRTLLAHHISSSSLPRRPRRRKSHFVRTNNISDPSKTHTAKNIDFSLDINSSSLSEASYSLTRFYQDFLSAGTHAYHDLRSSIKVTNDYGRHRFAFSCRRSSLLFVANLFALCLGAFLSSRALLWLFSDLRLPWVGGGHWSSSSVVRRRDRSLGGREVVVARRSSDLTEPELYKRQTTPFPVDNLSGTMTKRAWISSTKRRSGKEMLPKWWPTTISTSFPTSSTIECDTYQREADLLVRGKVYSLFELHFISIFSSLGAYYLFPAIMHKRMSGKDYKEDDIVQLRRICRTSGSRVQFDVANTRDSFFRASIDFTLNVCVRAGIPATNVKIDGEEVRLFLAGLAYNIELENTRAVVLLCAAVAAKTRSCFLQAWALEAQGKREGALEELRKISRILQAFPPDDQSPEMEMVASGLRKHLKAEQRRQLLNLFERVSNSEVQKIAAAALNLQSTIVHSEDEDCYNSKPGN